MEAPVMCEEQTLLRENIFTRMALPVRRGMQQFMLDAVRPSCVGFPTFATWIQLCQMMYLYVPQKILSPFVLLVTVVALNDGSMTIGPMTCPHVVVRSLKVPRAVST